MRHTCHLTPIQAVRFWSLLFGLQSNTAPRKTPKSIHRVQELQVVKMHLCKHQ
ncbi:hypothetical protein HanRHA438_Chr12g0537001 [Helianthus annuus]|nr:hypothetical protein HanRHA438_Chr12g0537001 [Helianthus annuus]